MAIQIKSIPILTGEVAARFLLKAEANEKGKKHSIDFTEQAIKAKKILSKARLS